MDRTPIVSVLVPAFDAEGTLEACLWSVERQRGVSWECVIVDDGSSDGSAEIARAFARREPRFRLVERPHRGLVPALATGQEVCRGRYVARMDADDVMHRERLALQVAALERHPEWAAVGCHVRLFPRRRLGTGYREYESWLNGIDGVEAIRREAFVECPVAHPALTIRRETLTRFGYRDRGWPEDYDLVLRLLGGDQRIGMVARRLLCWRDGPGRLSRNAPAYTVERFTACKAHFLAAGFLDASERYILWGYGGTGRALRRALAAHGKRPSHIVELHPRRIGNRIHGAPVVPRTELRRLPREPLIVSVAGESARREIREFLASEGWRETSDFVCAA